jgi:hypothetical protein
MQDSRNIFQMCIKCTNIFFPNFFPIRNFGFEYKPSGNPDRERYARKSQVSI